MLMFILAISCLTTSNIPWFRDLIFQVPMQYCSSITSHIHTWALFLLWFHLFSLPGVISLFFLFFFSSLVDILIQFYNTYSLKHVWPLKFLLSYFNGQRQISLNCWKQWVSLPLMRNSECMLGHTFTKERGSLPLSLNLHFLFAQKLSITVKANA